MGLQQFANNAEGTLLSLISTGAVSFQLESGEGAAFPTLGSGEYCFVRLGSDASNEVVRVTAISGDNFTCEATASGWAAGTPAILTACAEMFDEFVQRDAPRRIVALSDAATILFNGDLIDKATVTLAGNRTLGADTGTPYDGKLVMIQVTQDGTGSRTLAYTATSQGWAFTDDVPEPTLSTDPGAIDKLLFEYHESDDRYQCLAVNLGA